MKHLADELDPGGFIRVLLFEMHHETEGAVLEWCVRGAYYHSIPIHIERA